MKRFCAFCQGEFSSRAGGAKYCSPQCAFERLLVTGNGCWDWAGALNSKGYPVFYYGRKNRFLAHRFSWTLYCSPIPEGEQVLHRCDNPVCVRPSHLFIGTQKDNVQDMLKKGRHRYIAHEGEDSTSALLTEDAVRYIRSSSETRRALASRFGVTMRCIKAVRSRQNWKHVIP